MLCTFALQIVQDTRSALIVNVCVLPAKQDSIIYTYLALGCIAHKRKHNQTIVCQVGNESVALALCA